MLMMRFVYRMASVSSSMEIEDTDHQMKSITENCFILSTATFISWFTSS
jgi:hypothetical protein